MDKVYKKIEWSPKSIIIQLVKYQIHKKLLITVKENLLVLLAKKIL